MKRLQFLVLCGTFLASLWLVALNISLEPRIHTIVLTVHSRCLVVSLFHRLLVVCLGSDRIPRSLHTSLSLPFVTGSAVVYVQLPLLALVSFGAYSLFFIGYNLVLFRDCPGAFMEMQEVFCSTTRCVCVIQANVRKLCVCIP